MRIVVTGAAGFIGRNLCVRLRESGYGDVLGISNHTPREQLDAALAKADFVFHLAGVNRPQLDSEFVSGNVDFTEAVCASLAASGRRTPVAFASSTQATLASAYGRSKRAAEAVLLRYGRESGAAVRVFRLTNVFGKWSRPHYNSAVATFCYQISRGLPITVNDPSSKLRLLYIDDVVNALIALLGINDLSTGYGAVEPIYETTVGELSILLEEIANCRSSLLIPRVGVGLTRALYSTYISFLPPEGFAYNVARHVDPRGTFVEMLKTPDCGQFSYFTAHPGVTRGEHYHHTKTEKFLVVRGTARFGFRNLRTGETHELVVRGAEGSIVDSVPGWVHNVTNIGDDELIVMLWANEIFDRSRPDTITMKVVCEKA
ncbi:MAG: NAD-dependent epimerase/dehydratase family protein [Proteobacteria bacterium]|nr:NAD-dependent epimerase/dehydratase family protein [Pseudomonadota bacterium]